MFWKDEPVGSLLIVFVVILVKVFFAEATCQMELSIDQGMTLNFM